ncbi:MAG: cardiolipin synthase [Proteobacteria bacterium]|nr:MAG: cardiolipin synthase [Pseudomonadota bacterium]
MLPTWLTSFFFTLDLLLRLYFGFRILRRKLPVGVAWAWLSLILFLPIFGTILYGFLGEYRMGRRRLRRLLSATAAAQRIGAKFLPAPEPSDPLSAREASLARAIELLFTAPMSNGNDIELLRSAEEAFPQMIADVNAAQESCDMEFYIWSDGGRADDFGEALLGAAARGVRCRVLLDQVGSAKFLRGPQARRLRDGGVELKAALPSGLFRSLIARPDLRIHRKILVIDGKIAYTGSLNLADPKHFKRSAGVGPWVDAQCRLKGGAVRLLALVFATDWSVETGADPVSLASGLNFKDAAVEKRARIQCLPSGPALKNSEIEEVLLMAIYAAKRELVLTTPYFVPSESLLYALMSAARRGVRVVLIAPEQVDSRLTHYASRAFLKELIEAGVLVGLYRLGMLHTKSVTVDGNFSLFGSLNLDPRSLRINFEITLAVYDEGFAGALVKLQESYLENCVMLDSTFGNRDSWITGLKEDLARLAGPLL